MYKNDIVHLLKLHYIVNLFNMIEYFREVLCVAYNEAKKQSNRKSDAKYQQILLKPYKAEGERIRAAAAAAGKSVQGFILDIVREKLPPEPEAQEK